MSYANVMLYSAIIPEFKARNKGNGKRGKTDDEIIDADDPRNREMYLKFIKGR